MSSGGGGYHSQRTHNIYEDKNAGNEDDAEWNLQQMYKQQLKDFDKFQAPIMEQMVKESQADHITRMGGAQADSLATRTQGRVERSIGMDSNYLLPSQRAAMQRTQHRQVAMSKAGIIRGSQLSQQEHNMAARQNAMHMAENIQTKGILGAAEVARADAERRARAQQAKGSMMAQVGSIAGAVIGTVIAPGVGTMIGASIGGGIGGATGS